MRIAIIGAGGVGGFLGGLLARAGHEVAFLARGQHLEAIRQRGLELRSRQFGDFTVKPKATSEPSELGENDLVLVAVKMYDFAVAAEAAKAAISPDGRALTIQNGLDAPRELAKLIPPSQVLAGTASIEAAILRPGVIGHLVPMHSVTVSELEGPPTPRLEQLAAELKAAGVHASVVPDGMAALWQKACGLIPFATLTAAAGCTLGELASEPASRDVAEALMDEAVAVADACGYDMRKASAGWRGFLQRGAETTPDFTSSLNRDFRAGKPTELEWLTGTMVRLACEKSVPVPTHQALYGILKLRAATKRT
jgi:2-dehydropantoate 2-reductase